jgi:hopanoid biosynthesis associated protein HpnK
MNNFPPVQRRLIVNADDFGRSSAINEAIIRAHREGILTSASLMVNEPACDEAVALARENPRLAVGLHLSLGMGRSALPPEEIPGLVNADGLFPSNPVRLGWRYFAKPSLRGQLYREVAAQFKKFRATNLRMDHVNGHLHLHMQPVVFRMLADNAGKWGITHMRLTREPLRPGFKAAGNGRMLKMLEILMLSWLARRQRRILQRIGIRHTQAVFGQWRDGRVDEDYLLRLLPLLPLGDSELYSHPSMSEFKHEFDALISPRVRELAERLGIHLIRYRDL